MNDPRQSAYPEHDKLRKISDRSQACGEFLDWLEEEKGWELPSHSKPALLAEFFEIDQERLEDEKQAMLNELRS